MGELIREKRIVSLNSNNATRYLNGEYLSDIVFDFQNILSPSDDISYVEVGVGNAEIPATFYNIDVTNNVLNYRIDATNFIMTVPPGNYNYNSLVTQMTTLLTANGHTFTFSLNRNSNILTMTLTAGGTTWNRISLGSTIYYILGFDHDTIYNIVGNTITFPRLFNLLGQKKLKIYSSNISVDSFDSVNTATNNLLCTISVNQPGFNLIIYSNIDGLYSHMRNRYLSTVDIQIKDELGNLINFNGINWTMTLNIILYRRIDALINELKLKGAPLEPDM
jgi:hypothetical protein